MNLKRHFATLAHFAVEGAGPDSQRAVFAALRHTAHLLGLSAEFEAADKAINALDAAEEAQLHFRSILSSALAHTPEGGGCK